MSAPLTPEQRETHEAMLLAMSVIYPHWREACLAGAAALRAAHVERTCGTCQHFRPWFPDGKSISGYPDGRGDCTHRKYAGRRNGQSPVDGCLLGWRARETETPT